MMQMQTNTTDQTPRRFIVCGSLVWRDRAIVGERLQRAVRGSSAPLEMLHSRYSGAEAVAVSVAEELGIAVRQIHCGYDRGAIARRTREMFDLDPELVIVFGGPDRLMRDEVLVAARRKRIPVDHVAGS